MNENEIRRVFFYAMQEAGMYDSTIKMVAPSYDIMHEMMLDLAVEFLEEKGGQPGPVLALDLGAGTGAEAIPLMKRIDGLTLVGVDLCKPMCEEFRKAAESKQIPADRYRVIHGDLLDPDIATTIRAESKAAFGSDSFQLIISAFTFHHLDAPQKQAAFQLVYELLAERGTFLLGDLFNYADESDWLTERVFHWEVGWIARNFEEAAIAEEQSGNPRRAAAIRNQQQRWNKHYFDDNVLDSITTQLKFLKNAGFREAGNPFRYWQVGLICARK